MTERDEGRHGLPPRRKKTARFPAAVRNDEFLYHLHRGSSLLLEGDVHGAKVELENALAFQPQDAKSQDLLAGVYFRLGLYPRAIEIWEELVDAYPHEPTLRVNLGLAYFKTRQTAAAREQLREALRDQPAHPRAWGYLGLAEWRLGHLSAARDAFRRGGHTGMAERMEAALVGAASAPP
ncbi:MAG: tetratricopeptide repeat protein, partial [Myxococcota bacterium]